MTSFSFMCLKRSLFYLLIWKIILLDMQFEVNGVFDICSTLKMLPHCFLSGMVPREICCYHYLVHLCKYLLSLVAFKIFFSSLPLSLLLYALVLFSYLVLLSIEGICSEPFLKRSFFFFLCIVYISMCSHNYLFSS